MLICLMNIVSQVPYVLNTGNVAWLRLEKKLSSKVKENVLGEA